MDSVTAMATTAATISEAHRATDSVTDRNQPFECRPCNRRAAFCIRTVIATTQMKNCENGIQ